MPTRKHLSTFNNEADDAFSSVVAKYRGAYKTEESRIAAKKEATNVSTHDFAKIKNKWVLIDYKSTISIERIALQLAAYSLILQHFISAPVTYGVGVAIKENGTYSMTEPINLKNYRREFLALRATYAVRERLNLNGRQED